MRGLLSMNTCRWLTVLLWTVGCFVFYQFFYPYHFFYKEQNQLFLWTGDYLSTYFDKPAWLACLIGDFLTQFYYYLYAGSSILTLSLLLLTGILYAALRNAGIKKGWAFGITLLIVTLEAVCHLRCGFRLSSTYALIGGVTAYLCFSRNKILMILCSPVVYWLFGYGAWVFLLLWAVRQWRWALPVFLVLCVGVYFLPSVYLLPLEKLYTYPGIGKLQMPEWLLEKQFQVDDEYYFGNWNKVVRLVEQEKEPTAEMLFFYNLVKAQQGQLPDVLLAYEPNTLGTFYQIGPQTPLLVIKNMNELYYALGDMTFCERAAMMACVFSPDNRNNRMVKRLAECALIKGDSAAAAKYLGILEKTFVWHQWARQAPHETVYQEKAGYLNQKDTIATSDNAHVIMMQLLDSNGKNEVALDYILCSTLLLKDVQNFKRDYDRYCSEEPRIRRLYQEALCIWLAASNASQEEWMKYIKDPNVVQRFMEYNQQRGSVRFNDTYWYYFDKGKAPKI